MNDEMVFVAVDTECAGVRVTLFEQEIPRTDALRMYRAARKDARSLDDDLVRLAATEVIGECLHVDCFFDFLGDEVSFPMVHALDAIEEHFRIPADTLRKAMQPDNLAALVLQREADYEAFIGSGSHQIANTEIMKAQHAAIQEAIAAEINAELTQSGIGKH